MLFFFPVSEDKKSVSVSFTRYNNLGQLMSDTNTGANIRSDTGSPRNFIS